MQWAIAWPTIWSIFFETSRPSEEPLEFGFSLPGRGPLATPDLVLKIALKAESLRYASVFVTDHVVLPDPPMLAPPGLLVTDNRPLVSANVIVKVSPVVLPERRRAFLVR